MANKDLFKQAIADAKSIREAAIANAKLALEETITPELQSLLAAKLQEMEEEDEDKEDVEEAVEEAVEETVEETVEEEVSEEVEEVVAEEEAEDEEAEDDSEESEDEAEEDADEELDGDEKVADSEMTVDDIKDLIRDILAQELDGDEPAEEEGEEGMEDMEDMEMPVAADDEEEIDINELLAELATMTEEKEEEAVEETVEEEVVAEEEAVEETVEEEAMEEEAMEEEMVNENDFVDLAEFLVNHGIAGAKYAMMVSKILAAALPAGAIAIGALKAAKADKADAQGTNEAELNEALETVETLRKELNETNLLNAKLLYVNKVFKANNLNEGQKANVIAAFDKAETVKEVKLVFETVSENIPSGTKKEVVREARGFASAAVGKSDKPEVITEANQAVLRMQKLAGIIK